MVYVLHKNGNPLMPTKNHSKVRCLLKNKQAKVVSKEPFTIQLLYNTSEYIQNVTLGVDSGCKHIGISATTEKDVLFEAVVEEYDKTSEMLQQRSMLRRTRRSRKTRYRKPRFMNRTKSKKDGWIAPSIKHTVQTHLTIINKVNKILPIKNIIVEIANFDIQKIKNPNIKGKEYQEGEMKDYYNVKQYVLDRDNHICQCCKGKSKCKKLNVHHIKFRSNGGGNSPLNLITLCEDCHSDLHDNKITLPEKVIKNVTFKFPTHMNIMKNTLIKELKQLYSNVDITYGYETKYYRDLYNLPKEHYVDARCISRNYTAAPLGYYYIFKKLRCHNRQIHKCIIKPNKVRPLAKLPYIMYGFRMFDKVLYSGKEYFVYSRRNNGSFSISPLYNLKTYIQKTYKKLKLIEPCKHLVCQKVVI